MVTLESQYLTITYMYILYIQHTYVFVLYMHHQVIWMDVSNPLRELAVHRPRGRPHLVLLLHTDS